MHPFRSLFRPVLTATVLVVLAAFPAAADILELKNGQQLNGRYDGGTAGTVRFSTDSGQKILTTNEVASLVFNGPPVPVTLPPAATAPAPTPAAAPKPSLPREVTIPAGTPLTVRMMDSVSSQDSAGALFTTKLETNLTANGIVVVPAGTIIYGRVTSSTQERLIVGRSSLEIQLHEISLRGTPLMISTGNFKEVAQTSGAGQAARGALAGAAVGGLIDGNDGAQKGAAIGAAVGVLQRGKTMTITPGTVLQFSLMTPVTVPTS
jgi:hypothetical protein